MSMSSKRATRLRCFAEFSDGVWVAYCVDLGLGAQGDSFAEAKGKLELQISDLAEDLKLSNGANAEYLLSRRAPASIWAKYWFVFAVIRVRNLLGLDVPEDRKRFRESFPAHVGFC